MRNTNTTLRSGWGMMLRPVVILLLVALMLFVGGAAHAQSAVGVDNAVELTTAPPGDTDDVTGTQTKSYTVNAGLTDRYLVVEFSLYSNSAGAAISGVTYAGAPLTMIHKSEGNLYSPGAILARYRGAEIWALKNPLSGNNNIAYTITGTFTRMAAGALTLHNVDQVAETALLHNGFVGSDTDITANRLPKTVTITGTRKGSAGVTALSNASDNTLAPYSSSTGDTLCYQRAHYVTPVIVRFNTMCSGFYKTFPGASTFAMGYSAPAFQTHIAMAAFQPLPTTLTDITALDPSPTASTSVQYEVEFSHAVTGLAIGNFSLTTTGGQGAASIASVTGSGATWTVTVNTVANTGTIRLNMANSTGVTNGLGNPVEATFPVAGDTYTVQPHTVTFDLGVHGTRTGGGELVQLVLDGQAAAEPVFDTAQGWTFNVWDVAFDNITSDLTVTATYTPNTNNITYAPVPVLGGLVGGSATIVTDTTETVTVTVNAGYTFVSVTTTDGTLTDEGGGVYTLSDVTTDTTVTAMFTPNTNSIAYTSTPVVGGSVTGPATIVTDTTETVIVTVNPGYTLASVTASNGSVTAAAPYELSGVTADTTVTATFTPIAYAVTYAPALNGTVTGPAMIDHSGTGLGATISLTVTPDAGYSIGTVTATDGAVSAAPYELSGVTADTTVTATFTANTNNITYVTAPVLGGTVTGSPTIVTDTTETLTVTTNAGYTLVSVTASNGSVTAAAPYELSGVTADTTVTATFTANTNNVTYSSTPAAGGSVTGPATIVTGTTETVVVTAGTGYDIVSVTVSNGDVSPSAPYLLSNVTADTIVTATFELQTVSVPDVVDQTQADAGTAITGVGLVVGTITQLYSATVPAGSVISQLPVANTLVLYGDAVNLSVSVGPEPAPLPDPVTFGDVGTSPSDPTQLLTGSGQANGGFVVNQGNGVEIGIRAQLRFDANNQGQNIFNNNGDGTYSFPVGTPNLALPRPAWATTTTPVWSLVFAVNTDVDDRDDTPAAVLADYTYELGIDFDPTLGTGNWLVFDPISANGLFNTYGVPDHAFGLYSQQSPGIVPTTVSGYANAINTYNIVQNSANYEFFNMDLSGYGYGDYSGFDPNQQGIYNVYLAAFSGGVEVARTEIQVLVGDPILVPNVVGMTQVAANTAITDASLVVGTVTQVYSDTVPAESVISQDPVEDTIVMPGSAVNLVVSAGPFPPVIPEPVTIGDIDIGPSDRGQLLVGDGLANGGFTVDRRNGVEVGIRGQLRFDANNQAQNIFNSNGDGTYSFPTGTPNLSLPHPAWADVTTPIWSVVLSVNTDYTDRDDTPDAVLADYTYEVGIDFDPSAGTGNWLIFDPVSENGMFNQLGVPDHAFGLYSTQNPGVRPANLPDYVTALNTYNIAQNAANFETFNMDLSTYGLGDYSAFDPNQPGIYTIYLAVLSGTAEVARTQIQILVGNPVTVPDVVGMTQVDAANAITGAGLVVGAVTQDYSPTVPAGSVISQDPVAGASASSGDSVALVVSQGPQPVAVPEVVGLTQVAAETALNAVGLSAAIIEEFSNTVPAGTVISQLPVSGTMVLPGTAVDVTVSKGPETFTVAYVPDPAAGGTVSGPSTITNTTGTATVTVTANAGYTIGTVTASNGTITATAPYTLSNVTADTTVTATFTQVTRTITYVASPVAGGTVSGPSTINDTTGTATVTVTANAGYVIGTVTATNGTITALAPYTLSNVTANTTVTATFTQIQRTITYVASPIAGGTVTGPATIVPTTGTATVIVTANAGYVIGTVTATNGTITNLGGGSYTLSNVTVNTTVTATFTMLAWNVSYVPSPAAGGTVTGPATIGRPAGQTITVTVTANASYAIGTVTASNGAITASAPYVLSNVTANTTVTATFTLLAVAVPNVVGQTQSAATDAITGAGFVVGTVTQQYSATVPSGNVIAQSPLGGVLALPGSAVSLVVSSGVQPVSVPNVVGMTQASARAAITGASLVVGTVTEDFSDTAPLGSVMAQTPVGGVDALPGSAVDIVISKGPGTIMPDVLGMTRAAAETAIQGANLLVGQVVDDYSATVPVGQVLSQSPAGGTEVARGIAVSFVISLGPAATVPDLTGMTLEEAQTALTDAGFQVQVTEEASDTVPEGQIISQGPAAGTMVPQGSTVNLVVSTGSANPGCGCLSCAGCQTGDKGEFTLDSLRKMIGDIFLLGLSVMALTAMSRLKM